MPGVEILSTNQVCIKYAFNMGVALIIAGVICGLTALYLLRSRRDNEITPEDAVICMFAVAALSAIIGGFLGIATKEPVLYETQYRVIVSDSVPMSKFLEKYEIIDTDGETLVVRDRETGEYNG
nr:MAG TPA: hypothetical protein [Caudoviricetes sp.]